MNHFTSQLGLISPFPPKASKSSTFCGNMLSRRCIQTTLHASLRYSLSGPMVLIGPHVEQGNKQFHNVTISGVELLHISRRAGCTSSRRFSSKESRNQRAYKLQEEATRGQFWELHQLDKTGGKLFEADEALLEVLCLCPFCWWWVMGGLIVFALCLAGQRGVSVSKPGWFLVKW